MSKANRRASYLVPALALLTLTQAFAALAQTAERPVPVEVAAVQQTAVSEQITAVGSLIADESVVARPEIAGRIREVLFKEGQTVAAGALLVRLDSSIYEAELAQAQAALALTQRTAQRAQELFRKGAGPARTVDESQSSLAVALAEVTLAQARLAKTALRAPFAGILGLRRVSVGDYVIPGQAIVNLEDIDPIKADFRVPETRLADLRVGQRIEVVVDAFPKRSFVGEVYAIDPQVDVEGRSVSLRARIPNPDRLLRPGLFARIDLTVGGQPDALLVPEQAIFPRGTQRFVYRVIDHKAVLTEVETGPRKDGRIQILEGLSAGESIIIAGQMKLHDGRPVEPIAAGPSQ